jgi:hypothetical protein
MLAPTVANGKMMPARPCQLPRLVGQPPIRVPLLFAAHEALVVIDEVGA